MVEKELLQIQFWYLGEMANYVIRGKFSSVQSLSRVQFFAIPWTTAWQGSLSSTNSWSLLKFMSIALVEPYNHLSLCHLLLLPSIFPSIRGVFLGFFCFCFCFSSESLLHIRWPKFWSFNFSISPFSEYSGLISFRMDWLDLLVVQGTLETKNFKLIS